MRITLSGFIAAAILLSWQAVAHHSTAMFAADKEVSLTGIVTDYQWTNPHSWIEMDVATADGKTVHYSIELGAPRSMQRTGWKVRTLKPGDKVTLVVNPMKNGTPGGLLVRATLPDGKVLEYQRS